MIWADDTHEFSCSTCLYAGTPCPAAVLMAERLVAALRMSEPFTGEDFEITGTGRLTGCERGCATVYVADKSAVRVFCNIKDSDDADVLIRFAAGFFGPGAAGVALSPVPDRVPCAMVQALPHGGQPAAARMAEA